MNARPLILHCPRCGVQHLDVGEWADRPHRTHQCQACGKEWTPADEDTVGVAWAVEGNLPDETVNKRRAVRR